MKKLITIALSAEVKSWLCRHGWHGWDTWLTWTGRWFSVRRKCARPGCFAEDI